MGIIKDECPIDGCGALIERPLGGEAAMLASHLGFSHPLAQITGNLVALRCETYCGHHAAVELGNAHEVRWCVHCGSISVRITMREGLPVWSSWRPRDVFGRLSKPPLPRCSIVADCDGEEMIFGYPGPHLSERQGGPPKVGDRIRLGQAGITARVIEVRDLLRPSENSSEIGNQKSP